MSTSNTFASSCIMLILIKINMQYLPGGPSINEKSLLNAHLIACSCDTFSCFIFASSEVVHKENTSFSIS